MSSTRSSACPARSQSAGPSRPVPSSARCGFLSNTAQPRPGTVCPAAKSRTGVAGPYRPGPSASTGMPSDAGEAPAGPDRTQRAVSARRAGSTASRPSASCTSSSSSCTCQVPGKTSCAPSASAASHSRSRRSAGIDRSLKGWRLEWRRGTAGYRRARAGSGGSVASRVTSTSSAGSAGSGSSRTTGAHPAAQAATRRLNSAAPHPRCRPRASGSVRGSARERSAYRRRTPSAVRYRNFQGCALCSDGAAVASATSAVSVFASTC